MGVGAAQSPCPTEPASTPSGSESRKCPAIGNAGSGGRGLALAGTGESWGASTPDRDGATGVRGDTQICSLSVPQLCVRSALSSFRRMNLFLNLRS